MSQTPGQAPNPQNPAEHDRTPGTSVVVAELPSCDLHQALMGLSGVTAHYDGRTRLNASWAYMCERCFGEWGVGLGTGRGQKLILEGP